VAGHFWPTHEGVTHTYRS